ARPVHAQGAPGPGGAGALHRPLPEPGWRIRPGARTAVYSPDYLFRVHPLLLGGAPPELKLPNAAGGCSTMRMRGQATYVLQGGRALRRPPQCLTWGALAEPFCAAGRAEIHPPAAGLHLPEHVADAAAVGAHEGPLRRAVLRLKFEQKAALAAPLGSL